jgi:predicted MFS family arabinose efflux permease
MTRLPQHKAITVFMVLALAYFLSTLIRAVTATLAPTLMQELVLSAADLGLLAGGYFLGFSLTQLPLGMLLDRLGPKRVETVFLMVAVVGCVAFSMATSFASLLLARVLCGAGLSACLMAPLTGYRRWFGPGALIRANAWMLMVGALGTVASTLPVQWLLPLTGWRPIFLLLGSATGLAALLIVWQLPAWSRDGIPKPAIEANAEGKSGYAEIFTSPYFRSLAPLGFFGYGGLLAMQTLWVTPWMVRVAGYGATQAAGILFGINLAMLISYWLWGMATPRLAHKGLGASPLLLRVVPFGMLPLLALVWTGESFPAAAPVFWGSFCVLATVCTLAQPALGLAFQADLAGRALSAYNLVVFCGVFAVQWGMGLAIDALRGLGATEVLAYRGALAGYALAYLLSYLYFLRAKRP